jgi:two-component system, probable response regulator PhcQ
MGIVLILDDDANLLEGLRRTLRHEPYEVLTAQTCEEALELIQTASIDLIISDQDMPGMSGATFLKYIRKRYPYITRFMLTGKATLDNAIDAINNGGISRFFTKPCDALDLVISIRQGLEQKKLMIAAYRLLQENASHVEKLAQLEKKYPNITKVDRDPDGAIRIDDCPENLGRFWEDIDAYLNKLK